MRWIRRFGPELPWAAVVILIGGLRVGLRLIWGAWPGDLPSWITLLLLAAYALFPVFGARLARAGAAELPALARGRVALASIWGPAATMAVAFPLDGGFALLTAGVLSMAIAFLALLVVVVDAFAMKAGRK